MGEYPILQFFTFDHLPDHLADVSRPFAELAEVIAAETDGETITMRVPIKEYKGGGAQAIAAPTSQEHHMTTTDTTDPWCDENDTPIAVGDWALEADRG